MRRMAGFVGVAVMAAVCGGCGGLARRDRVGVVTPPNRGARVGDYAPEFEFRSARGEIVPFSVVRGDVTIVSFAVLSSLDADSTARQVSALAERYSGMRTNVRYVAVSEAPDEPSDLLSNVVEMYDLSSKRVIGLCDRDARVRRAFGAEELGTYFLIGGTGRVTARGKLSDLGRLELALRDTVSDYEAGEESSIFE